MKQKIKAFVKGCYRAFWNIFPISNVILFESAPVYADNSRAVFDEMIRRGMQKKYRFIWLCPDEASAQTAIPHAISINRHPKALLRRLYVHYLYYTARACISCNETLTRHRKGQYAICLMHGAPLKNVKGHYAIPQALDDILSFSSYLNPIDEECADAALCKRCTLGFPRNDILFHSNLDTHSLFPHADFDKLIYWMPTYRQHKLGTLNMSTIAMPILYNEEIAKQVNDAAKKARVLVVVKPHFAQDVSRITMLNLSNLVFINDDFLAQCGIINYELLAKADALLTDYSSVYYDYLLTDRPIGLCWDDYEDFKAREGFVVDMDTVMAGGEKLYTADDLCGFIARLAAGEDALQAERAKVTGLLHDYPDGNSTQRVVDRIQQKLLG